MGVFTRAGSIDRVQFLASPVNPRQLPPVSLKSFFIVSCYGMQRAALDALPAACALLKAAYAGCFAVTNVIEGEQAERAGRHTATASAAACGIDLRDALQLWFQSPRSICFHVNSGLVWVREKG